VSSTASVDYIMCAQLVYKRVVC